jgi:thymidylate synthase (FAD)
VSKKNELIGKRVEVLDKGWIELQDLMGDDLAIVNAARVSFLGESKGSEQDKKLRVFLLRHRHTTPFDMVEFKFRVRWPLMVAGQWMRHRTWNYNEISRRYTSVDLDFYHPDIWRKQSPSNKQASEGEVEAAAAHQLSGLLDEHHQQSLQFYNQALAAGVAREQARIFLPQSMYTQFIAKVDAHNLLHFIELRMAPDAQHEIRVYAKAIFEEFVVPAIPWTAEAFRSYRIKE